MKVTRRLFDTTVSHRGVSLLETLALCAIIAIALTGALSVSISHQAAERSSEERRLASAAATQKLDEIRIYLQNGNTLDQAFDYYGPLPLPTGGPGATFNVPGLTPFYDYDKADGPRPNPRAIGTVTIINDEAPNEASFGFDYANQAITPPFGVDVNSNGSLLIETGFGAKGATGYNDSVPWPFPLDINNSGSDGSTDLPWDSNVISNFEMLPVVITIQWQGVNGPQRYDLFTIITSLQDSESGL